MHPILNLQIPIGGRALNAREREGLSRCGVAVPQPAVVIRVSRYAGILRGTDVRVCCCQTILAVNGVRLLPDGSDVAAE